MNSTQTQLDQFKARARVFADQHKKLKEREAAVPESMKAQYHTLVGRGEQIKERIKAVAGAVDSSARFAQNSLGVSRQDINTLGFLPLIPLALIAGSTVATTYFVTDAHKFNAEMDEIERLQEMGYSPEEAVKITKGGTIKVPTFLATLWNNRLARYGALGALGFVGYQKFIKPRIKHGG